MPIGLLTFSSLLSRVKLPRQARNARHCRKRGSITHLLFSFWRSTGTSTRPFEDLDAERGRFYQAILGHAFVASTVEEALALAHDESPLGQGSAAVGDAQLGHALWLDDGHDRRRGRVGLLAGGVEEALRRHGEPRGDQTQRTGLLGVCVVLERKLEAEAAVCGWYRFGRCRPPTRVLPSQTTSFAAGRVELFRGRSGESQNAVRA